MVKSVLYTIFWKWIEAKYSASLLAKSGQYVFLELTQFFSVCGLALTCFKSICFMFTKPEYFCHKF